MIKTFPLNYAKSHALLMIGADFSSIHAGRYRHFNNNALF
jgi:hypothetical protein